MHAAAALAEQIQNSGRLFTAHALKAEEMAARKQNTNITGEQFAETIPFLLHHTPYNIEGTGAESKIEGPWRRWQSKCK
jgi:hypothetical protein